MLFVYNSLLTHKAEEISNVSKELVTFTRHYLRSAASTRLATQHEGDTLSFDAAELQQEIQLIKQHISLLQVTLEESEEKQLQRKAETFNTSHQRAHYHSIVVFLLKAIQDASKRFQFVRRIQSDKAKERIQYVIRAFRIRKL